MKLGLGTAQFGMPYGITNVAGQTSPESVAAILSLAAASNVDLLDTAPGYGNSEQVLGASIGAESKFRIVTKTIALKSNSLSAGDVGRAESVFIRSLETLGVPSVYGILVHDALDLLADNAAALYRVMTAWKRNGLASRIGVSLYTEEQGREILGRFPLDLVQVPLNVFDQRMLRSGFLRELRESGVEIHCRSLFLQGLLLADIDRFPPLLERYRPAFDRYFRYLNSVGLTKLEGALRFAKQVAEIDRGIIGCTDASELREILKAYGEERASSADFAQFASGDESLLTPGRWRSG